MAGPAYHARTHLPGGTDPVPCCGSGNAFTTYQNCTLARPTLWSFWPMSDVGPGAADLVGGRPLTEFSKEGYPAYGQDGPFLALPLQTSILVVGDAGGGANDEQRLWRAFSSGEWAEIVTGTHAYSIEMWVYPTAAATGGLCGYFVSSSNQITMQLINHTGTLYAQASRAADGEVGNTAAETCPLNTWTHLRCTYDGATLSMYVNGTLTDTDASSASLAPGGSVFVVFNLEDSGANYLNPCKARIADLAIYSSAVTDFCTTGGEGGGSDAPEFYGGWADGEGGLIWNLVSPDNIAADAVTADALAVDAVTTPAIAAGAVTEAEIGLSDVTTLNASTSKHGFLKKLSNVAGEFMNGVGNWVSLATVAVTSIKKTGSASLVGDVTLSQGANVTLTQTGQDITIAATITGGGAVDSLAAQGDTPMVGDIEIASGTGISVTQDDVDTLTIALGTGAPAILFDYEVAGSDKASIDTNSDGPYAGAISGGYSILEIWLYARTDEAVIPSAVDLRFNNDSGANYDIQRISATNTTLNAAGGAGLNQVRNSVAGASAAANVFGLLQLSVVNYAGTVGYKTGILFGGEADSAAATGQETNQRLFSYRATAAITRVAVAPTTAAKKFKVGTRLIIFGR